ncbi:hypothetical protein M413DRAFT_449253 [Hebeloma cylindrosporum]|uniref:MINDY deubiquitinase domain-containing protein n=1 Tax=Hebeloma cylindrosporum TaxID=76867 RepID=A0A0C2Y5Q0_HEBCY|nr:hypothetical protein M413DRAFT_449253 [Hebeloma cylindrosporum h7]
MSQQPPTIQSSLEDVWYLKSIQFNGRKLRIITQNFNGPCSFIAICNILILRGNIDIQPPTRRTVSYEFLSQLVAEYLLTSSPDVDVSAALSIMPYTQKGMDLNPVFTDATAFHPSTTLTGAGGELKLFEQVGISLLHGWLVDPDSPEAPVLRRVQDYDTAVGLIAEVDHLTNGKFVVDDQAPHVQPDPTSPVREWTDEELQKVKDATVVRRFLDSSQSQLTYHGLFNLALIPPNTPCALFRSSHLSVLYKYSPGAPVSSASPPNSNSIPTPNAIASSSSSSSQPAIEASSSSSPSTENIPTATQTAAKEQEPQNIIPQHEENSALYTLVTDQVFLNEPSVVWERLEDVDGGWSTFVDSDFVRSSPAGGDFAGQTAEEALRAAEAAADAHLGVVDPDDRALAQQLQAEEEHLAREEHKAYLREQHLLKQQQQQQGNSNGRQHEQEKKKDKHKKKSDCVIM